MSKVLYVGDMHVTPDSIDECSNLLLYIWDIAVKENVEAVVFLGDQYHNHSLVNVEVMKFWLDAFSNNTVHSISLVGNHDRPNDASSNSHAMMVHNTSSNVVVDRPREINGMLFLPFMHDPKEFVEACNASPCDTVVCHQEFNGGKYENGFYSANGVDPASIRQKLVISGHVHTPQTFDKVWYVGAPRWRSVSDANIKRNVYVVEHDISGAIVSKKAFDTSAVCSQIVGYNDTEQENLTESAVKADGTDFGKDRIAIDIFGTESYCKTKAAYWKTFGARIRTFPTAVKVARVKESDGVSVALGKYSKSFIPPNGSSLEALTELVAARVRF